MSVQSEVDRINTNVQSSLSAISETGVEVPEGANSDNLPAAVAAMANEKQDKLSGTKGQVVGFDESGNAVAQDANYAPASHASDETIHVTADQKTAWDAKATTTYVDQKIAAIPTPDVSGQIGTHNADTAAHADIRAEITKSYDKVISMGEQLVVNGNGFMGNNTNFSRLTFDGSQTNNSPGSFRNELNNGGNIMPDEFIPIDVKNRYKWSMDFKCLNSVGPMYSFIACYDVDKNEIISSNVNYLAGTKTKLTRDLVAGDTHMYVEDVSAWSTERAYYTVAYIWNYANSFGYIYPAETYTRNKVPLVASGAYLSSSAIDAENNTLTLEKAYTGVTIPAGTELSQGFNGHSYDYGPLSGTIVPTEWKTYEKIFGSGDLKAGTAYIKMGFLWNYGSKADVIWGTNFSIRSIETPATDTQIANRSTEYNVITPTNLDSAIKAAMCDGKGAAWTDDEKAAARTRMGSVSSDEVKTMISAALGVIENGAY